MLEYHLAEINVAKMKGVDIDDPIMKDFVDNLDKVNAIAESSKGFVWRYIDESNNATTADPFNDKQMIVNLSVWKTLEDLEHFMYHTFHMEIMKRKKEWFKKFESAYVALWWIKKDHIPTLEEAMLKLKELNKTGPTPHVFNFKKKYKQPSELN